MCNTIIKGNKFTMLTENPIMNMLNVKRFSNMPFIKDDTDANHTVRLQLMSVILFQDNPKVDLKELIYKCALHDVDEAMAGDVISPIKHCSVEVSRAIEEKSIDMLRSAGVSENILYEITNAKDASIEGRILSILDVLDAYYILLREYNMQKLTFLYDRADDAINYANDRLEKLFEYDDDNKDIYAMLKSLLDDAGSLLKH